MPELSRFQGMVIKMLFNDTVQHNKPHVHVSYGEYKASVGIDGELLADSLPQKQFKMLADQPSMKKRPMLPGTKLSEVSILIRSHLCNKEWRYPMFVLNGIVYASEKRNDIEVISVKPLDDMMMILTFSTGEQRLFDATILTGSAFLPLKYDNIFKNCKVIDGAVTWMDEKIDCAPEFMYENSFAYPSSQTA